uniref:Uncharacterized protein n=1 Tax=viral metagenome TaxID=1070528 RepID=A0A6C0ADD6_9ZZZZ
MKIDENNANIFINSQLSFRRGRAAKNLIENTNYFTFNDIFEKVRDIIIKLYERKKDNKYVMYVSNKESSIYFISLICLYFIKLLEYEIPEILMFKEDVEFFKLESEYNCELFVIDDCLYSGGQMTTVCILFNKFFNKIHVGAAIANIIRFEIYNSNCPIDWYVEIKINSFKEFLSKEEYLDIMYFSVPDKKEHFF